MKKAQVSNRLTSSEIISLAIASMALNGCNLCCIATVSTKCFKLLIGSTNLVWQGGWREPAIADSGSTARSADYICNRYRSNAASPPAPSPHRRCSDDGVDVIRVTGRCRLAQRAIILSIFFSQLSTFIQLLASSVQIHLHH